MKRTILLIICMLVAFTLLFTAVQHKPEVSRQDCTGCGDCVKACPVKAISVRFGKAVIDTDKCIDCKLCTTTCTFGAIR